MAEGRDRWFAAYAMPSMMMTMTMGADAQGAD